MSSSRPSVEWVWYVEATFAADATTRREPWREAHLARVARLLREGRYVIAGAFDDLVSSVVLVRAESSERALALVGGDPYVGAGVWVSLTARRFGQTVPEEVIPE